MNRLSVQRLVAGLGGFLLVMLLAGCAGEKAYRSGLEHLDAGQMEEGLAHLEEAARLDPDNFTYRIALRSGRERAINRLLAAAEMYRGANRFDQAATAYERILKIEPANSRARNGLSEVKTSRRHEGLLQEAKKLLEQKDLQGAQSKLRFILAEDPQHSAASALLRDIEKKLSKDAYYAPQLGKNYRKPVTLQFRDAQIKLVFEAISRTTGINFILDRDIKNTLKTTIFAKDMSVDDALDLILSQSQLEKKILSENTVLVYPNIPAKAKEYQDQVVKTFYLTNADPKKALSMLKTMLDTKVFFADEKSNVLIMRDTPEMVRMAEKLLDALDLPEPEVMMEVEVLEIKRSRIQELGIDFPDQLSFTADATTFQDFKNLDATKVLVGKVGVNVDLKKEDKDTNVLASPRIRARNKEKAKIHIGDRVPVITNSVTPTTTQPVVTGSVQYLDVGLKLEVEPTVYLDNEVAIKVGLEVSTIVSSVTNSISGTVAYQIGTRNAATLLRLKDGETQILAGLISDEDRETVNKVPGFGDVPMLGRLFSTHKDDKQKTEIVLSITPHIVRNLVRPDANTTEFWFGTEGRRSGQPLTVGSGSNGSTAVRPAMTGTAPVTNAMPAATAEDAEAPGLRKNPLIRRSTLLRGRKAEDIVSPASAAQVPDQVSEPVSVPVVPAAPAQVPVVPGLVPAAADKANAAEPPTAPASDETPEPVAPTSSGASTPGNLSWDGPSEAVVGQEFLARLNLSTNQLINGMSFQIKFDPAAMQVVSVGEGSLVQEAKLFGNFRFNVNDKTGVIDIKLDPSEGGGLNGQGDLLAVTFLPVAAREKSIVTVQALSPVGTPGQRVTLSAPGPLSIALKAP